MTPILSIIIPVFNVQLYIETCLQSILSQLVDDVELILVDDGSPDESINIVKKRFSEWLSNGQIILLQQENKGPGAARNFGLSVARGEYIGFLDSDDILLEDYFSIIFETIGNNNIDIIEFGFQRFHELSDIKSEKYIPLYKFNGCYKLKDIRNHIFSVGVWFPSTRVYKRSLFENIQFPVGVFYEDLMTIPYIYLNDLNVYFVNTPLIGYRFNPSSTTAMHSKPHAKDLYAFYMDLTQVKRSIPIEIIRIKVARSILYFHNELGNFDVPIADILSDINKIKKRFSLLRVLKYPDLFFFLFTKVYLWVDKARLTRK